MATAPKGGRGAERAFASPLPDDGEVVLDEAESRHLVRVRRARVGDEVVLFDGRGALRRGRLASDGPKGAVVRIEGPETPRLPARRVAVAVALPAAGRADDLLEALAEMGVVALLPLLAERATVDAESRTARRRERWERIAREALKVSGGATALRVEEPVTLPGALSWAGGGAPAYVPVLLHTDPALPSLYAALEGVTSALLLVGPEGGFTDAERAEAARLGARPASLGGLALRTETAAAAAAAVSLCP